MGMSRNIIKPIPTLAMYTLHREKKILNFINELAIDAILGGMTGNFLQATVISADNDAERTI
jgi:hypothetical protein